MLFFEYKNSRLIAETGVLNCQEGLVLFYLLKIKIY
jgi:hypothetical protein